MARNPSLKIRYKIASLVLTVVLLTTAVFAVVNYLTARAEFFQGVDARLTAATAAVPLLLPPGYTDRALAPDSIGAEEFHQIDRRLTEYADRAGVYYVYTFVLRDGKIYTTSTSESKSDRQTGSLGVYWQPYYRPPRELFDCFRDGKTRYAEYTDEFAQFRSRFVPITTASGHRYVVGADEEFTGIRRHLLWIMARDLGLGLLIALICTTVGVLLSRRLSGPIAELSGEVGQWHARGFTQDSATRARLERIGRKNHDEIGALARRFVELQDKLGAYLTELTSTAKAKQRAEHQLEVAREVQESLLPQEPPQIPHFRVDGWSQPADETGGDYFDWLMLPDGRAVLTLGDVTGHGIGPALVTAASRAYARAVLNGEESLDTTIARLNDLLHGDLRGQRFVTLVACLLDPATRHLSLVAAGHGPTLIYSAQRDEVEIVTHTHGIPLGIFNGQTYDPPLARTLAPGDAVVLVSDGFFEWMNSAGEQFGSQRLHDSILTSCRESREQIIERLRKDVADFTQGTAQADDTTALVIRCVG
jgi:sigma-B regulation protein RsbU (phosphoserine phosphatase)